jgi:phage gpG-like protein
MLNSYYSFDLSEFHKWEGMFEYKAKNLPYEQIQNIAIDSVYENFVESGRPNKWEPRKPNKHDDGHQLLFKTGHLATSFVSMHTDEEITISSNTEYGKYLNEGTKFMPQREFMFLQKSDVTSIEDLLSRHFTQ